MAKKAAEHEKGKKHLHGITIHKTEKPGEHVITHHYKDHEGNSLPDTFGGAATDMQDLHDHIDDHLAPEAEAAAPQQQEPPPAQGAPAEAAAPQGAE